jgi:TonB-linked SusC/RagA family outer membrane protein
MAELGVSDVVEERLRPQFRLQYRIARWLSYEGTAAFDVTNRKNTKYLPQETVGGNFTGFVNISNDTEYEQVGVPTFNKLVFTPNLGDMHNLTTVLQYEVNETKSRQTSVNTANAATSMLRDPSIPSRVRNTALSASSNESKSRRAAAYLQTTYSLLDSRYVLTGSIRMDGNSGTAPDKQYKMFPSVSGRWNIGREPFMRGLKERLDIYNLSLRASWGYSGNSGGNSNLYNRYGSVGYEYLGTAGIIPSNIAAVSQEWQNTYQSNFGFDMDILDGRFTLGYEYYVKRTTNMSASQDIPAVSGFNNVSMNAGAMKNEGWEFQISTRLVKKTDFGVDVAFNISQNQNTITELSDRWDVAQGDMSRNGQYLQTLRLNNPVGSFYGYRYLGVYANEDQLWAKTKDGEPSYVPDGSGGWTQRMMTFYSSSRNYMFQPGDAIYADMNYDGNIDVQDIVYLGNSNPKYQGGGNLTVRYKQFRVNLYFNYRWGNDVWNRAKMDLEKMEGLNNQSTAVLRRWRYPYADPADQPADILPRPVYGANNSYNYLGSDRFIEDASFIRLNSMNIRYDLPKNLLSRLKIRTAYLTFNMRNIMTFTDYTGQDPEVGTGGIPYGIASDGNRTPPAKSYQLTLSVGF